VVPEWYERLTKLKQSPIELRLTEVVTHYQNSFTGKEYGQENEDHDLLMDLFGISPEMKRENRQYWGRELGMCWQRLVTATVSTLAPDDFSPPIRIGADEPYDLGFKDFVIDTKYRLGSGDAGTLKKFKSYGEMLRDRNKMPVQLILRSDNLPAAISALKVGGWDVRIGDDAFSWIEQATNGFKLDGWLEDNAGTFQIN
jgi:hypothetical protein